jgi:hypothetical protein
MQQFDLHDLALPTVVAFAARCARRIQPLYAVWSGARAADALAIEQAIVSTEEFLRSNMDATQAAAPSEAAYAAAAFAAAESRKSGDSEGSAARNAANAAVASHAAADAVVDTQHDSVAVRFDASHAANASVKACGEAAIIAANRDLELLRTLEFSSEITLDATGPLGPYWLEPPDWWHEGIEKNRELLQAAS